MTKKSKKKSEICLLKFYFKNIQFLKTDLNRFVVK